MGARMPGRGEIKRPQRTPGPLDKEINWLDDKRRLGVDPLDPDGRYAVVDHVLEAFLGLGAGDDVLEHLWHETREDSGAGLQEDGVDAGRGVGEVDPGNAEQEVSRPVGNSFGDAEGGCLGEKSAG